MKLSRRISLAALVLLMFSAHAALAANAARAGAAAKPLNVLTANVGNMGASRADYNRQFKISEYDLPVLKDNLARLAPDVVFLQEIDARGLDQQKRIFSDAFSSKCAGELCVGLKKDTADFIGKCEKRDGYLVCTAHRMKRVPAPETCRQTDEGYVCTTRRTLENREVIKLINMHSASPADDKDFGIRKTQICGMLEEARGYHDAGMNVIIGGDFNFDPYVYESSAYNRANEKDPLFLLGVCWSDHVNGGLKLISTNEPTWFTKEVKMFFIAKKVYRTMDHVISSFGGKGCRVLEGDKARLDVDRTGSRNRRDTFMDHRAVMCGVNAE